LSQYSGSFTEVDVNGTWNSWCGTCNPLSDPDMDNIWTGTFLIPGGQHEFKYTLDGWTVEETLMAGLPCVLTTGGFTNRVMQVDGDSVLNLVCWESCDTCVAEVPTVNVTFRVDMKNETVSTNGVHVAGSFQGWDPLGTPMTDPDMDNIFEVTVPVDEGDTILYKFINGNDWPFQEPNAPLAPCGIGDGFGGINRQTAIGSADLTLDAVCFGSCDTCSTSTGISENDFITHFELFPNPADDILNLRAAFAQFGQLRISIMDLAGREIYTQDLEGDELQLQFDLSGFSGGMYWLSIRTANGILSRKFVVE
jgi:hypothetical protein